MALWSVSVCDEVVSVSTPQSWVGFLWVLYGAEPALRCLFCKTMKSRSIENLKAQEKPKLHGFLNKTKRDVLSFSKCQRQSWESSFSNILNSLWSDLYPINPDYVTYLCTSLNYFTWYTYIYQVYLVYLCGLHICTPGSTCSTWPVCTVFITLVMYSSICPLQRVNTLLSQQDI